MMKVKIMYCLKLLDRFGKIDNFNQTGIAIDVHMSWISEENKYITEYLVTKEYLTKVLSEKAGLRLIDTEMFGDFIILILTFL